MQQRKGVGLDSLELKALSVPSSLLFLLGIEYDVLMCVTEINSQKFKLHFPPLSGIFKRLLELCAARFALQYKDEDDGSSVLSGSAVMPLLRYADYLPGALAVAEILDCLGAQSPVKLVRTEGSALEVNDFQASFLDYSAFNSDAPLYDVHGLGFYLTIEHGLSMATHSHLVSIRFHSDWDPQEALREFQDFSGWDKFDMRFFDESDKKQGGVIVMPSIQDVCDLLEMYEDEDSDDEGDLLPFILRPVAPLVPVPSVEDSTLRKMRDQHWDDIEAFWKRFERTKYTVVVYNLYENATLDEVTAFFDGIPIVSARMVVDNSPKQRRRAFLTFADGEATKAALALDGKSTKGRTIRVQVSPPYISPERRGHVLNAEEQNRAKPERHTSHRNTSAAAETPKVAPTAGACAEVQKTVTPSHAPSIPAPRTMAAASTSSATAASGVGAPKAPSPVPEGKKAPPTAVAAATESAPPQESTRPTKPEPTAAPFSAPPSCAAASGPAIPLPASKGGHHSAGGTPDPRKSPSVMNAGAKAFVPQFALNVSSPEFVPQSYPFAPPPPPAYGEALASPTPGYGSAPPSARLGALSEEMEPLPAYALPPPYVPSGGFYGANASMLPPPPPPPPPY